MKKGKTNDEAKKSRKPKRKSRVLNRDIEAYKKLSGMGVSGLLKNGRAFCGRKFNSITVIEVMWSHKEGETNGELIAKCRCNCGNILLVPLRLLLNGDLTDCGCRTPLRPEIKDLVRVHESESYTPWATTVEGIMWYGVRLMWAVSRNFGGRSAPMYMTDSAEDALQMRMKLEKENWGESLIEKYYAPMLKELQSIEHLYLKKHPPKIEGISYIRGLWQVRLWVKGELVMTKYCRTRKEAVRLRYNAEKKFYGESLIPEKYYV